MNGCGIGETFIHKWKVHLFFSAIGFVIGVVSDGDNGNAATAGVGTGFDLLYTQRGCP